MKLNLLLVWLSFKFQTLVSLKILIHSDFGGRSHIKPILEITQELQRRQHEIIYAAIDDNEKFLMGYNNVTFKSLGNVPEYNTIMREFSDILNIKKTFSLIKTMSKSFGTIFSYSYEQVYPQLTRVVKEESPDVIICDFSSPACGDVAEMNQIPLIRGFQTTDGYGINDAKFLSHQMEYGPLTTETYSFYQRFYDGVMLPLTNLYYFSDAKNKLNRIREKYGVQKSVTPFGDYGRSLGIANTFVGFEPAVPSRPNIIQVGPILSKSFPPLTSELISFLDENERVLYVGFGSNVILAPFDIENIVLSCLLAIENGHVDGVIWGLGRTRRDDFPMDFNFNGKFITTNELFNLQIQFKILNWAPQVAILNHPHTKLFLSHGGLESSFEAIKSQTPVLTMSFYADQPRNARKLEEAGVGSYIDRITATPTSIHRQLVTLLANPVLSSNLVHLATLAHINSRIDYAADLIESYVTLAHLCRSHHPYHYGQPGCEVNHLIPASSRMSTIRSYQLDTYLLALSLPLLILILLTYFTYLTIVALQAEFTTHFTKSKSD